MPKIVIKTLVSLLPAIPLFLFWNWYFWDEMKVLGFVAYYYLVLTLFISPLSSILRKKMLHKKIAIKILPYRRIFGIITSVFAFLHAIHFEERVYDLWQKFFIEKQSYTEFIIDWLTRWFAQPIFWMDFYAFLFGIISITILFMLFITSNNLSQNKLWWKLWKKIQKWVYPLFIILVLHIYFIGWWKWLYLYPAIWLIGLRLYIWFEMKKKK